MRRPFLSAAMLGIPWACGADKPLDHDAPYCDERVSELTRDEVSDLGFSAAEVLAEAEGDHDSSLVWVRDGSATPLALGVVDAQGYRFVDSEAVYPDNGIEQPDLGVVCDDRLEVDVAIDFATEDGAFAESWSSILVAVQAGPSSMLHELEPDGLSGTYDVSIDIESIAYDDRALWAEARFDADGASGWIRGQASGQEDCAGDTCAAWSELFDVASWGGEPE